ncbi:hypothetical protein D9M69_677590 [compost metagenome]
MIVEVVIHGGAHGGLEDVVAEHFQQSEAAELVLDRVLHFREMQLDAARAQGFAQLAEHVRRGDVDAGDRLSRYHQPAYRRRRFLDGLQYAFPEQLGIGEEQRRVPAEQHQAGHAAGFWIALQIVIAA